MADLKGKTLFVTGGSRGIGLAIALRAARDGANVIGAAKTDRPHPKLPGTIHSAAQAIEAVGGKALAVQTDIRDEEQVLRAVEAGVERFGVQEGGAGLGGVADHPTVQAAIAEFQGEVVAVRPRVPEGEGQ